MGATVCNKGTRKRHSITQKTTQKVISTAKTAIKLDSAHHANRSLLLSAGFIEMLMIHLPDKLFRYRCTLLKVQQPFLSGKSTAITGQVTVLTYHPVTRNQDCDSIIAVGRCNGPHSRSLSHSCGKLFIRNGFSIRKLFQIHPYLLLKICSRCMQWNCKLFSLA